MKEENRERIQKFLEGKESLTEDIFTESEKILGSVPVILDILSERDAFFLFSSLANFSALRPRSLDGKTAELITMAAAAGAGAEHCLKLHMRAAKKAGATRDEILDTLLIASIIGQTRVLATSLRVLDKEFRDDPEK
ncbi:MAG TPA: carboxymuconolactone decarboxylase family protein [Methanomicrobiales archaeon]|nr:carboxymuconolactone decarboxylase family protein [Methanomicrobiales archaeon]